jgi:hypothetical protein
MESVFAGKVSRVEFLAPAFKPVVALLAPTGEGETVWRETMGVVTSGTKGAQP